MFARGRWWEAESQCSGGLPALRVLTPAPALLRGLVRAAGQHQRQQRAGRCGLEQQEAGGRQAGQDQCGDHNGHCECIYGCVTDVHRASSGRFLTAVSVV